MDFYEKATKLETFEEKFISELTECTTYNSRGILNMVVDVLIIIKERIIRGDIIFLEKNSEPLNLKSYEKLLENNFNTYIVKAVYKERPLKEKVYFNIENSESGLDLIPTGVVYIRNAKTRQLIPFVSEKGNYYLYAKDEGKIKEIF